MANAKISALPSATTPLAGTETLPVVQSNTTRQVNVANLTAGRSISASGVTVTGLTASKPVFTDGSFNLTSSGTVPTNQGGTGLTSFTANGVVYASSTSVLATASSFVFNGTNVGVGTDSPAGLLHVDNGTFITQRYATSGAIIARRANGTAASPTSVSAADSTISILISRAYDGAAYQNVASIQASNTSAVTNTSSAGYLQFFTTPASSTTLQERMRIDSGGNIYGTSGTTAMANGFFYIPAAAGAPTGVPTAISGCVPMYYDTTNNNFYVYNGAWKKVVLT